MLTACCAAAPDRDDAAAAADEATKQLGDQINEPLTNIEVAMVQESWGKAAELGAETVGTLLFRHIFAIAPEAVGLFSFKAEPNVLGANSPKVKAHGVKVVTTVATAVRMLNNLEELDPVLRDLALRHVGYKVVPAHFPVVGRALLKTLEEGLKADFTPKVRLAWSKVWKHISTTMIVAGWPEQAKPLSAQEVELIQGSWKKAGNLGVEKVGVLLFKHIFELAPEALQLFSFKDEKNVYESERLKSHAVKVVTTVGVAVDGLNKLGELVPVLKGLGLKHIGYGIQPAHYEVVGKALIMTLKAGLHTDLTPAHEAAWQKCYKILSTTMIGDSCQR